MNWLRHTDADFEKRLAAVTAASSLFDQEVDQRARAVIEDVAARGDSALADLTERFDGVRLLPEQFAVSKAELLTASLQVPEPIRKVIGEAERNIARFARKSLRKAWQTTNSHGARVGEKFDPFLRVGIYIPGGTAPLVSTALMTVTLARVAGCPEIVVCTPPGREGTVNPALLFAARVAGATEIYKVGGAQAIAAMALGTGMIAPVDKIFGPGNAYVVAAKRLLFGRVAVDLLPGPSEVLVLADDSAEPAWVAADVLAQAEHGSGEERTWVVSPSVTLLRAVEAEIQRQLPTLDRRDFAARALERHGWLVHVKSMDEGITVTNALAPEHCEIHARRASILAESIFTAGAIFLGPWSPTVLGDYVAGPSHTLPTGGAGRSFAGLTVDQFQRRTSIVEYGRQPLRRAMNAVRTFARLEGLDAHGRSAEIRLE